jgi:pyruvate,water dikinase
MNLIIWFKDCSYKNKNIVGGKSSSLGELYHLSQKIGFSISDGFCVTTNLYNLFLEQNNLTSLIVNISNNIDVENIEELEEKSNQLRNLICEGKFTEDQIKEIETNYENLCLLYNKENIEVAVRSSAVAEDVENCSSAGQQDTYLNVIGKEQLINKIISCFSSLFTSRAISYRKTNNIDYKDVKIACAVQKMIRSDLSSAGVAFSIDTENSYDKAIVINSSYGLGESVVSGAVKPDEFILDKRVLKFIDSDPIVNKKIGDKNTKIIYSEQGGTIEVETTLTQKLNFSLTNNQAITLARYVLLLEEEYSKILNKKTGIDCEFAIDGIDQKIYIIQTRPETVHSNNENMNIKKYILDETGKKILSGVAVSDKISSGKVRFIKNMSEYKKFQKGNILVSEFTSPDFEPLMKISSGVITMKGGRTSHAAIVSRELGLNCIVGVGNDIKKLNDDDLVTISCAEGDEGNVYEGILKHHVEEMNFNQKLELPVNLMLIIGDPQTSFSNSLLPNKGVGLVRMEFIINKHIKIHPKALINYPNVRDDIRKKIYNKLGSDHHNGKWFFIKRLARGIGRIASAFYPNDVIVRLSDFKSNEYRNLIGGDLYEPIEENPMIGFRGASRYYSEHYEEAFSLECSALKYVRETMKMNNIIVMIPFCRTPEECQLVLNTMEKYGLKRGENGLKVYIMCELPSNVLEADEFAPLIDGISIGGNDMLQMILGLDRDSEYVAYLSNSENKSYKRIIQMAIKAYKKHGKKVGFCGQQPSDSPEFAKFLIDEGIDSISVTPDSCLKTIMNIGV